MMTKTINPLDFGCVVYSYLPLCSKKLFLYIVHCSLLGQLMAFSNIKCITHIEVSFPVSQAVLYAVIWLQLIVIS